MTSVPAASRRRVTLGFLLLGLAAFAMFVLARVPATVLTARVEHVPSVALREVAGTIWQGAATLWVRGESLGRMDWEFAPAALFSGAIGMDWRLRHPDFHLEGDLGVAMRSVWVTTSGEIDAAALNRLLGKYHIRLSGGFTVDRWRVRRMADEAGTVWDAVGDLHWSGGRTTYRLSGQSYDVDFPPLAGALGTQNGEPRLDVFPRRAPSAKPLLTARLDNNGWLHISVTRRFTRLAGKPWPGGGDDDQVVVTVSEQVLHAKRPPPGNGSPATAHAAEQLQRAPRLGHAAEGSPCAQGPPRAEVAQATPARPAHAQAL